MNCNCDLYGKAFPLGRENSARGTEKPGGNQLHFYAINTQQNMNCIYFQLRNTFRLSQEDSQLLHTQPAV